MTALEKIVGRCFACAMTTADVGALFFDKNDLAILVKPLRGEHWDIPGTGIEPGQTPVQACSKAVARQLGLQFRPWRLLVADWVPNRETGNKVHFVFDGGWLRPPDIAEIRLDMRELQNYEFADLTAAADRLPPQLAQRLSVAAECHRYCRTVFLQDGVQPSAHAKLRL
jgi:8-oxo-dGTP diphosphatase